MTEDEIVDEVVDEVVGVTRELVVVVEVRGATDEEDAGAEAYEGLPRGAPVANEGNPFLMAAYCAAVNPSESNTNIPASP